MKWVGSGGSSRTSVRKFMASYPPPPWVFLTYVYIEINMHKVIGVKAGFGFLFIHFGQVIKGQNYRQEVDLLCCYCLGRQSFWSLQDEFWLFYWLDIAQTYIM